jgi:hypothetical protein
VWFADIKTWTFGKSHAFNAWEAVIGAALLASYFVGAVREIVKSRFAPPGKRDPNGESWMQLVAGVVVVIGVILAIGAYFRIGWIVRVVFVLAALPAVQILGTIVWRWVARIREARARRG